MLAYYDLNLSSVLVINGSVSGPLPNDGKPAVLAEGAPPGNFYN